MDKDFFRYDYVVIWANGLNHRDAIMKILEAEEKLDVLESEKITIENMEEFVFELYLLDSVPLKYLREKLEYLNHEKPEAEFVYVRHYDPDEYDFESPWGWFIRSDYVHLLKEKIRDTYNPYVDGKRTMENVVHASDHELQLDHTLRMLGHDEGIGYLYEKYGKSVRREPKQLDLSTYTPRFKQGFSREEFDGKFEEIMGS
jgi:hypothetical protein